MKDKIKVTFYSNFLLHHQTPFCEAMVKKLGKNFTFVATEKIPEERLQMGYRDLSHSADYAINAYEDLKSYEQAVKLGKDSDVVIIGSAPDVFIEERLKDNKLTFRYYERLFKRGKWRICDPRVLKAYYRLHTKYRKKNLHMLCASAYTAPDCRFISAYPQKTYKWGYFPPVKQYDNIDKLVKDKEKNSILWVARFIDWKHPELPIKVAKRLKKEGYSFTLNMIGVGPLQEKIAQKVEKYGLQNEVRLLGSMSPENVREYMEESEIFLFTSDKNEGWGAVLNESMNSGCAVVASGAIGSVPYLLEDGKNGLVYRDRSIGDLYKKTKWLLDNPDKRYEMGLEAYKTLTTTWNAETAAERLLVLIENIKQGKATEFLDGPCSKG